VAIAREQRRIDDAIAMHDISVDRLNGRETAARESRLRQHYHRPEPNAWTLSHVAAREAAIADLDDAIREWEKLAKQYPDAPSYLKSQGLGKLYRGRLKMLLGQSAAAASDLSAAAKIYEELARKYPDVLAYRGELGRIHTSLGQIAVDSATAKEWYRKAHDVLSTAS
jgi:tetratricopeptide (TPR) repeat protein